MSEYRVEYTMYGEATIEADSVEEAREIAREGLMDRSGDIDWEDNRVDGADYEVVEA